LRRLTSLSLKTALKVSSYPIVHCSTLRQRPGKGTRLSKVSREQLRELASEEDINAMWTIYEETFLSNTQIDDNLLATQNEETEHLPMNAAFEDDMGIPDDVKVLSLQDLHGLLACNAEGVFPGFNSHRALDGHDPWEGTDSSEVGSESTPLRLRWHQLVGVMVLLRHLTSTQKPISPAQGILIADEVGLGKSAQYMAFLSILLHAARADECQTSRPPALGKPAACMKI